MSGLANLPKAKWSAAGKQPGLKGDMVDIESAILQSFELRAAPSLVWVDATQVKVPGSADNKARVLMTGFPNFLHPGQFLPAGLTDGKYRENTSDVSMDFDVAANLWGTEKASQLYAILAIAGASDTSFTLKAMPWMRFKSQASQVISLGTIAAPATGIGYGFTTDELVGGKIYVITGTSRGLMRSITANNNDNGTGGTITYGGTALTMSQGDWFIVLPPTNFRWLGDIVNDATGNIQNFVQTGDRILWKTDISGVPPDGEVIIWNFVSPLADRWAFGWVAAPAAGAYVRRTDITANYKRYNAPNQVASGTLETAVGPGCTVTFSGFSAITIYPIEFSYPAGLR